ncbi:ABC-2 type transport system permease protein [Clostridium acetobutylicum]|uniref:ABC-type MDR transport system, permease component n=1 Tax=Clostridium acetobutylicum (strain ATCC 824 / DSM 792 / JCM 1419 / IAM 19013 / LMG 5710 / NBRC 13948 / NRRL B-527 / VKM B-1787 / 2291 / W) TaxID=272562 RepID=Q97D70_CLOAB|nr:MULTISPECIES: ABC transporter permease [Clostridium]AAK81533.1 ABC-type MDR transport system, permease component [Clostridium acetobutylicum ATCC 824]ADZ22654.1 ABC-type MDR transport system, permease component [Clostridium acetobutylicum EA 2018]AEI32956.1 ABC-type MDR transport system, permease component [Clostridium acetobutylicum DSM 1731]AWV80794.1 ABC transporter permease [Clostridium acetobutylicum]MBC2393881.1 ABC transporter permease [Clostridium acetobutylicum]
MIIINIFKNNLSRLLCKKAILLTSIIFIPLMIIGGVYFTSKMDTKANIAIVTKNKNITFNNKYVKITTLSEKPALSELVLNKYDAVVTYSDNIHFKITTIKSNKLKHELNTFLKNPKAKSNFKEASAGTRGTGTNILGFLILLLATQEIQFMLLYPEDRDLGTFRRILISPTSFIKYLLSEGIFDFVVAFIPSYIAILITKEIFKVTIGFNYLALAGLLSLLLIFGTSFALLITSIIDDVDNAAMLGTFIVLLCSILSGSFYSFTDDNKILSAIVSAIPYKQYLTLSQGIESGRSISNYSSQVLYIISITLVFFILGTLVTRKNLQNGKY